MSHPFAALFPMIRVEELDGLVADIVNDRQWPPAFAFMNTVQRAMFAGRVVNAQVGRPKEDTLTIAAVAQFMGIPTTAIHDAKTLLRYGTPEELALADAGKLPMIVAREIREGQTPQERAQRRPGGLRAPPVRRPSIVATRVLARIAEDEAAKARKRERDNATRARRQQQQSPGLPEILEALLAVSQAVPPADAAAQVRGRIDRAQLTALVEWLIELDYDDDQARKAG